MVGALAFLLGVVVVSQDLRQLVTSGIDATFMKLICESRSIFPPCCTPFRPRLKTLLGCVVTLAIFSNGCEVVDIDRIAAQTQVPWKSFNSELQISWKATKTLFFITGRWRFWASGESLRFAGHW